MAINIARGTTDLVYLANSLQIYEIHIFSEESKGYFTKLLFFGVNRHVNVFDQNSGVLGNLEG